MTVIAAEPSGDIAPLRLPDPERLFQGRAERLGALAQGHAAAPFLELLAAVARGQHVAAREVPVPAGAPLEGAPLDAARWRRDPAWRAMLRVVLGGCGGLDLPGPAREALARLGRAGDAELEALADEVIQGAPRDLATAPFVGAALQVYFARLAARLDPAAASAAPGGCPACGAAPVASVILGSERLRYAVCSLCSTQWHVPRVQCVLCRGAEGLSYYSVEGAPDGTRAEACERCRAYVKLFDLLEAPAAEPVADDAATLVLDLLMGERGHRRAGVNLLAPGGVAG